MGYRDQDLLVIYVVAENLESVTPTIDDLNAYAIEHNISYPLLADPGWQVCNRVEVDNYIPSLHVFTPGPTWHTIDGNVTEAVFSPLLDQY